MSERAITVVGVIGAGQMGRGIAQVAATSGYEVRLADATIELAQAGKSTIEKQLARLVEKGKLTASESEAVGGRIAPVAGAGDFGDVDLAIEAATENLEGKLRLFATFDAALPPHAIFASNTSSISVTKLGLNHPMGPLELADLIGLDTVLAIADVLHRELGDSKYRAPARLRNLVAAGWLGKKTGHGFYRYDASGAKLA